MRYIPTSRLTPGMALGQDIYDGAGRLLLARHLLLTAEYISNLEFLGFPGIYIDDEFTQGIEIQQVVTPEVRCRALKLISDMFAFEAPEGDLPVSEVKLRMTVENVVEDVLRNGDVMCSMMDIRNYDDYIYYHSVNVGVLSAMVGARYGLPKDQLYQLTITAMLHDIGKKFLEYDVANADRPLTEEETEAYRQHTRLGAEFLRSTYNFTSAVYTGVLMHHEHYNGEGYPFGKSGNDIPLFARIIRMNDSYDRMLFLRPQREQMSPSEAMEYLMAMAGAEFDPELVNVFLRRMAVYPIGCEVELSNGQHGVVIKNFQDFALRPLVKVIETGELLNLRDDPEARCITIGRMVV